MNLPLKGVRVLDLSSYLSGPYGSMILGDLGADVVKIEAPGHGDHTREMPPHFIGELSAYFYAINRNKRGITLNLKTEKGLEIFYQMVQNADVVYDNFRPGVLARLKIDYETLRQINPRIVCCSVSGYGQFGPYSQRASYDLIVQALGGIMSYTGPEGGQPCRMGAPLGDLGGGIFGVIGLLAALIERQRTGVGRRVDVSMLDAQVYLQTYRAQYYLAAGEVAKPVGAGHVSSVPIGLFHTKDRDIVIDANPNHFFERLCRVLGVPELATDERFTTKRGRYENKQLLMELLQQQFYTRTADEWLEHLVALDVPAAPINTIDRALADQQVLAREMVTQLYDDQAGKEVKVIGTPFKFSDATTAMERPPLMGEHTRRILSEELGFDEAQLDALAAAGVI